MRKLLLLCILFIGFNGFAQRYSYRFSGALTEERQTELVSSIAEWGFFQEVKIRYKDDSQKGELLFFIPVRKQRTEEQDPYSIIDIKRQLIAFGLAPDTFKELIP